jgi:hypothetical protein
MVSRGVACQRLDRKPGAMNLRDRAASFLWKSGSGGASSAELDGSFPAVPEWKDLKWEESEIGKDLK